MSEHLRHAPTQTHREPLSKILNIYCFKAFKEIFLQLLADHLANQEEASVAHITKKTNFTEAVNKSH